jgi:hypothetical protein
MKKFLSLVALCALAPFAAFSQNTMSVDSVVVRPVNPDANDSVWVHIYGFSPYGTSLNGPITVNTLGMNHHVDACYTVGLISVITYIHDSVFAFQGPAGPHVVSWSIVQNGTQSTSCDLPVRAGQTQENVATVMGMEDPGLPPGALTWNAALEEMSCNVPGTLSVYSVNGQLLLRRSVQANTMVSLPESASVVVIAVLEQEDGSSGRLRIYCGK